MDALLAPIEGADHHEVGSITVDVVRAANGRVKRLVYPPGFRWSTHLKPLVGTVLCMYAHVGFLAWATYVVSTPMAAPSSSLRRKWWSLSLGTTPGSSVTRRRYSSSSMPKRQRRASSLPEEHRHQ